jgi:hypothetical protein
VGVLNLGKLLVVESTALLRQRTGDDVYMLRARRAHAESLRSALATMSVPVLSLVDAPEDGWVNASVELAGGSERASSLLESLVGGGVSVSAFEKTPPDLAALIERVIAIDRSGS